MSAKSDNASTVSTGAQMPFQKRRRPPKLAGGDLVLTAVALHENAGAIYQHVPTFAGAGRRRQRGMSVQCVDDDRRLTVMKDIFLS